MAPVFEILELLIISRPRSVYSQFLRQKWTFMVSKLINISQRIVIIIAVQRPVDGKLIYGTVTLHAVSFAGQKSMSCRCCWRRAPLHPYVCSIPLSLYNRRASPRRELFCVPLRAGAALSYKYIYTGSNHLRQMGDICVRSCALICLCESMQFIGSDWIACYIILSLHFFGAI